MRILTYLRSLLVILSLFPLMTLVASLLVLTSSGIFRSTKFSNRVIHLWARISCFLFGVEIVAQGLEKRPASGSMVLFNHRSFFDIIAICSVTPDVRFGAKLELFSIPFFGPAMRAVGTLPIARERREAAIQVLRDSIGRAKAGQSFALAPEGSRNTTDEVLLPFKSGPFLFAIESGVPLVPLLISGADAVWEKGRFIPATEKLHSKVFVQILDPVITADFIQRKNEEYAKGHKEGAGPQGVISNSTVRSELRFELQKEARDKMLEGLCQLQKV